MSSNYSLIDQGIVSLPRIIYSHDRDSTAPAPTSNSVSAAASESQSTPLPRVSQEPSDNYFLNRLELYGSSKFAIQSTTSWADIMEALDAYDESTFCKGTAINSKWITNDCPITCEPLTIKTAYRLTCGHSCDRSSLYTWWESSSTGRTCPLCRAIEPPCPCSVCPPTKPRCSCGQYH
jgi:hypothetical protein